MHLSKLSSEVPTTQSFELGDSMMSSLHSNPLQGVLQSPYNLDFSCQVVVALHIGIATRLWGVLFALDWFLMSRRAWLCSRYWQVASLFR